MIGINRNGNKKESVSEKDENLCENMSRTTAEEYKMLRTKLELVLSDEMQSEDGSESQHYCRVIGVTSALRGEGKSTTAINLAYTLAEAGYKVCLLEADMRIPSVGEKLKLRDKPGLSNVLTGKVRAKDVLQRYMTKSGISFHVIPAGDVPPLPSELLASANMERFIHSLVTVFDYVLLDLPPVNVVTDALTLSRLKRLDGMLLVVREKMGDRVALRHAIEQFAITGGKILGIVHNGSKRPAGMSRYSCYSRASQYYRN